jgi:hypothetical protein
MMQIPITGSIWLENFGTRKLPRCWTYRCDERGYPPPTPWSITVVGTERAVDDAGTH